MTDTKFSFKQFDIHQDRCAMKVGTDGVLLGAWAYIPASGHILDIGTGTGLLSLMAAQRSHTAQVTALEIDSNAAEQARENALRSPWGERITVVNDDFCKWARQCEVRYNKIISNPPYFEQSLLSPDASRTTARHTTMLTYDDIFSLARNLIAEGGSLSLVIPASMYEQVNHTAMLYGWGASRLTLVRTTPRKPAKRALCEWRRNHYTPCQEEILTLNNPPQGYSEEYIRLTEPFYLKL